MIKLRWLLMLALLFLHPCGAGLSALPNQDRKASDNRQEEERDYYKKWLTEDVLYIIAPAEKSVFEKLNTPEEREQFIEQFWYRRDPDPRTPNNEFKEEHYRRIAYTNERFSSGLPGWLTDRGRIYIIHGPPAEIESHPSGGNYQRPFHEGGGSTSTYPFEIWRYRYIEGMGNDIVIEFVDPTLSGEYRLALNPEEKDALLFVPGAGLTTAESLGLARKQDRPFFSPGNVEYPLLHQRARDSAFERYETYSQVQRATPLKYKDLKELVEVNVAYDNLPFRIRKDYFRLNEQSSLVPITLQIENKNLTFVPENGAHVAKVAVYGIVTNLTNRIITEFDDDLQATVTDEMLRLGRLGGSVYQKMLLLENRGRYKLDLVVKDLNSNNVGVVRQGLVPPSRGEEFTASSLVLSNYVRLLDEVPKEDQMFVLGDVWIRPSVDNAFQAARPLNVYLQLYNTGIDQTTLLPSLGVRYRILDSNGQTVAEISDQEGESIQFFSGQRIVLIKQFDLKSIQPGRYVVEVELNDLIKQEQLSVTGRFELQSADQIASNQSN